MMNIQFSDFQNLIFNVQGDGEETVEHERNTEQAMDGTIHGDGASVL